MSSRFEKSIHAAILAGALTLAGCSADSGGGGGGGASDNAGTTGGEDGGTTDGGSTDGGGEDGTPPAVIPPVLLGGTVISSETVALQGELARSGLGTSVVELRFSEPVEWNGDPARFLLRPSAVNRASYTPFSAGYRSYATETSYSLITSFAGISSTVSATLVEPGDDSTKLLVTFPATFSSRDTGETNLLRLSYAQGEDLGVTDQEGTPMLPLDLESQEGRWVPGNVWVPNDEGSAGLDLPPGLSLQVRQVLSIGGIAPKLAFGRVLDATHVALVFTEPVTSSGNLASAFVLRGNTFNDVGPFSYQTVFSNGESYSSYTNLRGGSFESAASYPIASVYPLVEDEANAVLILHLADPLGENADGGTGFLRLSYTEGEAGADPQILDRAATPNAVAGFQLSSRNAYAGNVVDSLGPPRLKRGLPPHASVVKDGVLSLSFTAPVEWGGADPSALFQLNGTVAQRTSLYDSVSYTGDGFYTYYLTWVGAWSDGSAQTVYNSAPVVPGTGVRQNLMILPVSIGSGQHWNLRRLRLSYTAGTGGLTDSRDGTAVSADVFTIDPDTPGNVFLQSSSPR